MPIQNTKVGTTHIGRMFIATVTSIWFTTMANAALVDWENPAIKARVTELVTGASSPRERAVRIHDFVRDEIKFGWSSSFYDQRASEVLASRVGFCNTKSTLFIAMLRAAGIEARQRFVNINSAIVNDFVQPGTSYVDHSYTEVNLEGRWMKVDSYVVDKPLADRARSRLAREGKLVGYGVHRNGTSTWNGAQDAFSQYVDDGSYADLTTRDFGFYDDVNTFYDSGNGVNRLPWLARPFFGIFALVANASVEKIRSS